MLQLDCHDPFGPMIGSALNNSVLHQRIKEAENYHSLRTRTSKTRNGGRATVKTNFRQLEHLVFKMYLLINPYNQVVKYILWGLPGQTF